MNQPMDANDIKKEISNQLQLGKHTKNVGFALGLAGCFLICGACYATPRDHALSAGDDFKSNGFFLGTSENLFDEDEDDYRIKQLKDHNAKQAAKIRVLRQELIEKTQNIYEIKSQLFKQVGDPRDKEKIAELNRSLAEKEEQMDRLNHEIQRHENTIRSLQKEIAAHEHSRDDELLALQQQVENLKNFSVGDQHELKKKNRQLETTQHHLTEALENKATMIGNLEHELSIQQLAFTEKSGEWQELTRLYATTEEESKRAIVELTAQLEVENSAKIAVGKKLKKAIAEKNALVESLQQEIESYKQQYELASADFLSQKEASETRIAEVFDALREEQRLTKEQHDTKVAALVESLEEANETSMQFQKWLYDEMVLHAQEKNNGNALAVTAKEKQERADALEEALNALVLDVAQLENALKGMQDALTENALTLEESQESSSTLKQKLEEQTEQNKVLSGVLSEKQQHLSTLEETLKNIVLDVALLDDALVSSQDLAERKLAEVATLEESSFHLQQKLEEEISQKVKITEALLLERQNTIALNIEFSKSQKLLEQQLEEELNTHKALTAALLEQQRRAIALDEAREAKAADVLKLESALLEAQSTIEEQATALNAAQELVKGLEGRLEGEESERAVLAEALQEKHGHADALDASLKAQAEDVERLENALVAAKKTIKEFSVALNESKKIEKELAEAHLIILNNFAALSDSEETVLALQDKMEAEAALRREAEKSIEDKESQHAALGETIQVLTHDVEKFEKALAKAQAAIADREVAINEQKAYADLLEKKLEEEKLKQKSLVGALEEKQKHSFALDEALKARAIDAERLESALLEAKEMIENHTAVLHESKKNETELAKAQIALAKHQDLLLEQQQVIDSYEKRENREK